MQKRRAAAPCRAATLVLALALTPLGAGARADEPTSPTSTGDLEALKAQMEALADQNREMRETIQSLRHEVRSARDEARAAEDLARSASLPPVSQGGGSASGLARGEGGALAQVPLGQSLSFQLLDVSLDVLASAGSSTATDEELQGLQGGNHDPRQRGFTFQALELSFQGAVDPWMIGETHILYFIDQEGESRFELEEAFLQTTALPWGLHEHGFQVEFGHFFTEFGRMNPTHPHAWDWQDQPFVLSRFFGEDGMRGPGVRVGWLAPLPWYSEIHVGAQNAIGETMVSFLANDEVFEERPIGGRPFAGRRVSGLDDLVYLTRWVNGFDLSDTVSTQLGLSALFGPNATGGSGNTRIFGGDVVVKWRPLVTDRGWPFLKFEAELLYRDFQMDSFRGCPEAEEGEEDCADPVSFDRDDLDDWGFYTQLVYGFRRGWSAGLRYEYGSGNGDSVGPFEGADDDPFRSDRHRISPLLVFQPSEFSRLRLQYNYDIADHLTPDDVHTVWAGVEFLFGSHPAHTF